MKIQILLVFFISYGSKAINSATNNPNTETTIIKHSKFTKKSEESDKNLEVFSKISKFSSKELNSSILKGIKTHSCEQCISYYPSKSLYGYQCIFYYCRESLINKAKLYSKTSEISKSCRSCYKNPENSYYNCVYTHCKSEIIHKVNKIYDKTSKISLYSCKDSCYYDWYYYGYNYDECVEYYCETNQIQIFSPKVPNLLLDKEGPLLNCFDSCFYFFEFKDHLGCIKSVCKDFYYQKRSLKSSVQAYECKKCYELYFDGVLADQEFYQCAVFYCKNEEVEKSFSYKKSAFMRKNEKFSLSFCELCYFSYTGDAFNDCKNYYCKDYLNTTDLLTITEKIPE